MSKMYSVNELSEILGIDEYTIKRWARQGKKKAVKVPDNSKYSMWLIPQEEVDRLTGRIDTNEQETD